MTSEPDPTSGSKPPSSPKAVLYERHDAAAVVSINRPERRNAVDGATAEALHAALMRFEGEEDARAMVLTGTGGVAFCAGADRRPTATANKPKCFSVFIDLTFHHPNHAD